MKIVRKKMKGIKVVYNRKLLLIIIFLILLFGFIIALIVRDIRKISDVVQGDLCIKDSDCVPVTCCHPTECVISEKKPNCEGIFCSAVCSGPLDCGAGDCGCVNNKCVVIPRK